MKDRLLANLPQRENVPLSAHALATKIAQLSENASALLSRVRPLDPKSKPASTASSERERKASDRKRNAEAGWPSRSVGKRAKRGVEPKQHAPDDTDWTHGSVQAKGGSSASVRKSKRSKSSSSAQVNQFKLLPCLKLKRLQKRCRHGRLK